MPLKITITDAGKAGVFKATGIVTGADGAEKGKATVYVSQAADGAPTLVLPAGTKSVILGNEVTEYRSYEQEVTQRGTELAKDVELTFSNLTYAL